MHSVSRNAVLALIGLTLVLHNTEEYFTFPAFLASPSGQLSEWLSMCGPLPKPHELRVALVFATVLPLLVIAWAILRQRQALLVAVLLVESVLLVNAGGHMLAALIQAGYVPGLITAVLINLPFGIYVLRRAVRENWIRARAAWQLIGAAVALHAVWLGSGFWMLRRAVFR
jgi:uncharacterized protein with HXXEE motif